MAPPTRGGAGRVDQTVLRLGCKPSWGRVRQGGSGGPGGPGGELQWPGEPREALQMVVAGRWGRRGARWAWGGAMERVAKWAERLHEQLEDGAKGGEGRGGLWGTGEIGELRKRVAVGRGHPGEQEESGQNAPSPTAPHRRGGRGDQTSATALHQNHSSSQRTDLSQNGYVWICKNIKQMFIYSITFIKLKI
jgi:hypothetical protein